MGNIAVALAAGLLTFAALYVPHMLSGPEAVIPALIVAVITYFVLARRTFRRLEAIFTEGSGALSIMPPRFDAAIATMERAYRLAPWQVGIRSQVDGQIGALYFIQKDFNKALPYLQRSLMFGHWLGGAMLGVVQYKKKDHAGMRKTMDVVTRRSKKQGLAWSLYAYLLTQIGDRDAAQRVLTEGVKQAKDDPRVAELLLAVQNGKKLKMRAYKEQWYQFHLERPPTDYQMQQPGGRVSRAARRGRW